MLDYRIMGVNEEKKNQRYQKERENNCERNMKREK